MSQALKGAKDAQDATTAERTAKLASFCPGDDSAKRAAALALAAKSVELDKKSTLLGWFQMALGMAQYRSGLFAEADATFAPLAEKEKNRNHIVHNVGFYWAMTLFRLSKVDDVKKLATASTTAMRPLPADDRNPRAEEADDVVIWLAYKETKALIRFDAEAVREKPKPPEKK